MDYLTPDPTKYGVPWRTDQYNGMPFITLGGSGLRVPKIGLGTWKIGYPETGDGARIGESVAMKIIDQSVSLGAVFWDTANRYNNASGNSERIIGKWFTRNPEMRRDVVLATKVFGGMDGITPNHSGLSRLNILESVYTCLERLQTDYIDLLYFHAYDPLTPAEESLFAVEDLIRQDLVRYFGVSNFSVDQLMEYTKALASLRYRLVAVQNQFDILNGEDGTRPGVLECCAREDISFIAWSPLARGLLTGRYTSGATARTGDRLFDEGTLRDDLTERAGEILKKLGEFALSADIRLSELVIAYMLTLPGMGPVIASVSNVSQLESNVNGGKLVLTDEQIQAVKNILEEC